MNWSIEFPARFDGRHCHDSIIKAVYFVCVCLMCACVAPIGTSGPQLSESAKALRSLRSYTVSGSFTYEGHPGSLSGRTVRSGNSTGTVEFKSDQSSYSMWIR